MTFKTSSLLVLSLVLLPAAGIAQTSGAPSAHQSYDLTLRGIEIRSGVTLDLHAAVFVDESHACEGNVALAIHGFMHTAATWERMVAALFDDNPAGRKICRVVALDMPGRGGSTVPANLWFGIVTPEDYAAAMLGALDQLRALHIRPDTVFAHSLGGLIVQITQQRLLYEGTDLRNRYGVEDVVLLAPATPKQIPVYVIDSGLLAQTIMSVAQVDQIAGTLAVPDSVWAALLFAPAADWSLVVPGAPTAAEVAAWHYSAAEPFGVLTGLTDRPAIDAGIFSPAHQTVLSVVAYEQDIIFRPDEERTLYRYLSGDETDERFVVVPGYEAVHETHISNPALLLRYLPVRIP